MRRWIDQLRPRNWLDALGIVLQLSSVIAITWCAIAASRALEAGVQTWPWFESVGVGALAIGVVGYAAQRIARREPIFRQR